MLHWFPAHPWAYMDGMRHNNQSRHWKWTISLQPGIVRILDLQITPMYFGRMFIIQSLSSRCWVKTIHWLLEPPTLPVSYTKKGHYHQFPTETKTSSIDFRLKTSEIPWILLLVFEDLELFCRGFFRLRRQFAGCQWTELCGEDGGYTAFLGHKRLRSDRPFDTGIAQ